VVVSNAIGIVPMPDERLLDALADEGESVARRIAATTDPAEAHAMVDVALTRAVRARVVPWGRAGIRLNAVAAGPVHGHVSPARRAHPAEGRTAGALQPMLSAIPVPLAKPVEPREVASVVEFLVEPTSSAIHGAVLFADGGIDALVRPDVV
jgi:NAD(P)-dependent dehydrogenase (short-subunit alcohol dehydrogenase family)